MEKEIKAVEYALFGMPIMNSLPIPSSLSSDILPLCNCTSDLTKDNPIRNMQKSYKIFLSAKGFGKQKDLGLHLYNTNNCDFT